MLVFDGCAALRGFILIIHRFVKVVFLDFCAGNLFVYVEQGMVRHVFIILGWNSFKGEDVTIGYLEVGAPSLYVVLF